MIRRYRLERTKSRHLRVMPLQGPNVAATVSVIGRVFVPEEDVDAYIEHMKGVLVGRDERLKAERDEAVRQRAEAERELALVRRALVAEMLGHLTQVLSRPVRELL